MNGASSPARPYLRRCATNVAAALRTVFGPQRVMPDTAWPVSRRQLAIATIGILVVLVMSMSFIDLAALQSTRHLPNWLRDVFDEITDYAKSGWFLYPLGLMFLGLAALPRDGLTRMAQGVLAALMVRVGFLFAAIGLPSLFATIIKRLIGRARPLAVEPADQFLFSPFLWRNDYAGLPSGHATTAFAVVVAVGSLWPGARTALWTYALLMAVARVALNAHYPSDVLAGAVTGIVGAMLVRRYFALRRLGFSVGPDGTIHQLPGPSRKRIKAVARELLAE